MTHDGRYGQGYRYDPNSYGYMAPVPGVGHPLSLLSPQPQYYPMAKPQDPPMRHLGPQGYAAAYTGLTAYPVSGLTARHLDGITGRDGMAAPPPGPVAAMLSRLPGADAAMAATMEAGGLSPHENTALLSWYTNGVLVDMAELGLSPSSLPGPAARYRDAAGPDLPAHQSPNRPLESVTPAGPRSPVGTPPRSPPHRVATATATAAASTGPGTPGKSPGRTRKNKPGRIGTGGELAWETPASGLAEVGGAPPPGELSDVIMVVLDLSLLVNRDKSHKANYVAGQKLEPFLVLGNNAYYARRGGRDLLNTLFLNPRIEVALLTSTEHRTANKIVAAYEVAMRAEECTARGGFSRFAVTDRLHAIYGRDMYYKTDEAGDRLSDSPAGSPVDRDAWVTAKGGKGKARQRRDGRDYGNDTLDFQKLMGELADIGSGDDTEGDGGGNRVCYTQSTTVLVSGRPEQTMQARKIRLCLGTFTYSMLVKEYEMGEGEVNDLTRLTVALLSICDQVCDRGSSVEDALNTMCGY
jgi:hypothetical protein